ncbi:hypothetical protein E4T66_18600 [Sinimarinibacterium sp. CAU 1509]|uniref:hypothetical protein n=1 Tax=Sinimarinibacterium sp. CAU 1509 TaxID=2562283 RepID=UPI0010AD4F43|nr:hypothetical protein [Sinimarinibacterium sp. CAU 1509]TJY57418.1 hypothetical protein E4T66_18600 [Sinimarinibacterium sp. CAU 1509]
MTQCFFDPSSNDVIDIVKARTKVGSITRLNFAALQKVFPQVRVMSLADAETTMADGGLPDPGGTTRRSWRPITAGGMCEWCGKPFLRGELFGGFEWTIWDTEQKQKPRSRGEFEMHLACFPMMEKTADSRTTWTQVKTIRRWRSFTGRRLP